MIITISTTFWDAIGRLADITWLIAFATADAWVIAAAIKAFRRKLRKVNGK